VRCGKGRIVKRKKWVRNREGKNERKREIIEKGKLLPGTHQLRGSTINRTEQWFDRIGESRERKGSKRKEARKSN
jgi:hypothetical protein